MREDVDLNRRILALLPIYPDEIRTKELMMKAERQGLVRLTVERKLRTFEERKLVFRRQESTRKVFYSRREDVRIEYLIKDFVKDISDTLNKLPADMKLIDSQLIDGSRTKKEGRESVKILNSIPAYLRINILRTLAHHVFKMLNDNLPEDLKGKEYYVGDFGRGLIFVPRDDVERCMKTA
jgi:DNA-binding transcriptional ArsR family regulator